VPHITGQQEEQQEVVVEAAVLETQTLVQEALGRRGSTEVRRTRQAQRRVEVAVVWAELAEQQPHQSQVRVVRDKPILSVVHRISSQVEAEAVVMEQEE